MHNNSNICCRIKLYIDNRGLSPLDIGLKMNLHDRTEELPAFVSLFDSYKKVGEKESQGVFVCAESGIGKTALIETALSEIGIKAVEVKVEISSFVAYPPGYYFDLLYKSFKSAYPEYKERFRDRWGFSIGFGINVIFLSGSVSSERRVSQEEDTRRRQVDSMIAYCAKENIRPFFFLQESHHIDPDSFEMVLTLARNIPGSYFIFEYSEQPPNYSEEDACRLYHAFANDIQMDKIVYVSPLEYEEAKKILKDKMDPIPNESDMLHAYKESNGNIFVFEANCCKILQARNSRDNEMSASQKPNSPFQLIVMQIIAMDQEGLTVSEISEILEESPVCASDRFAIAQACEGLISSRLIEYDDNFSFHATNVKLADEALNQEPTAHIAYGAYTAWLTASIDKHSPLKQWYKLLNAQLRFHDEAVLDTLAHLKISLCRGPLPKSFLDSSIDMANTLGENSDSRLFRKVMFAFFEIFFTASDFDSAEKYLEAINGKHPCFELLRFVVDTTKSTSIGMRIRAASLQNSNAENNRLCLFIQMSFLAYLMRFGSRQEAIEYARGILSQPKFRSYPEFYCVMKQFSVYLPHRAALIALKRCSDQFLKMGEYSLYARTRITYALRLAISGEVDRAREIFEKDYSDRLDPYCRSYYYLNNLAACNLLDRSNLDDAIYGLKQALTYPCTEYERMFMLNNLFVAFMLKDNYKEAEKLLPLVNESIDHGYSTQAYLHLRYTNLLKYYSSTSCKSGVERMRKALSDLQLIAQPDLRECIEFQLGGTAPKQGNEFQYVCELGYRPGFIGFWQMKIDNAVIEDLL